MCVYVCVCVDCIIAPLLYLIFQSLSTPACTKAIRLCLTLNDILDAIKTYTTVLLLCEILLSVYQTDLIQNTIIPPSKSQSKAHISFLILLIIPDAISHVQLRTNVQCLWDVSWVKCEQKAWNFVQNHSKYNPSQLNNIIIHYSIGCLFHYELNKNGEKRREND